MRKEASLWVWEERLWGRGYRYVAGIDEAGRGPLAGPVVAAAVILPAGADLPGVNDSKQLTAARREQLYRLISKKAVALGVGVADVYYIEKHNILAAAKHAMCLAVANLAVRPDYLILDAVRLEALELPQTAIVKGDTLSASIAAASIVAKVRRDHIMQAWEKVYPGYGFAQHKGYGTPAHLAALQRLGPCPLHRTSFRPIRELREGLLGE
ncbi:ribonuclease HII [Gelria sp. Kuro-4]|uniref:ribonuclease HII n=1 Tax=Gelria sp. Kuro-4 TaxID=2796927 RepID=UPI001BEFDED2|nr:ribonuclease HII [Gelria sp. Kuro-4]BCV24804.1 ribonuclease HII [Gelria sp. Kuro-4]